MSIYSTDRGLSDGTGLGNDRNGTGLKKNNQRSFMRFYEQIIENKCLDFFVELQHLFIPSLYLDYLHYQIH